MKGIKCSKWDATREVWISETAKITKKKKKKCRENWFHYHFTLFLLIEKLHFLNSFFFFVFMLLCLISMLYLVIIQDRASKGTALTQSRSDPIVFRPFLYYSRSYAASNPILIPLTYSETEQTFHTGQNLKKKNV